MRLLDSNIIIYATDPENELPSIFAGGVTLLTIFSTSFVGPSQADWADVS
jgi:hypothetical protein